MGKAPESSRFPTLHCDCNHSTAGNAGDSLPVIFPLELMRSRFLGSSVIRLQTLSREDL